MIGCVNFLRGALLAVVGLLTNMDHVVPAVLLGLLLHHGVQQASAVLTSNIERGGRHLACPGQKVVLTCSQTGTSVLNWNSDAFVVIPFTYGPDQEGDIKPMGTTTFTANLTEAVLDGSVITMTSTLTFTFTALLDGLTVECRVEESGQVISRNATVETDLPFTPQSSQLSVSGYGMGGATVTVEWTYPNDGPVADNYTVSLSVGEPVTTTELMAIIEEVPYDQPLTGSVVAANCIGISSPAAIEVPCGVPRPPTHGSVVEFTVTEVVYRCDPGFGPSAGMVATCESGNWSPTPPADLVCVQTITVVETLSPSATNFPVHLSTIIIAQQSELHTVQPSLTPTQSPTSDNSEDNSCTSVTVAAAVSATVSFVVAFLLGSTTGAVVLYCTVGKQSDSNCRPCPKSPENQYQVPPPGPMYETVSAPTQTGRENFELKENLAYGPVGN